MANLFEHILNEANRKKSKKEIEDFNKLLKRHAERKAKKNKNKLNKT
jgi:hypothetical protein